MTNIKSYTDIEQSQKLIEILPLESADMCYLSDKSLFPRINYNGIVFFNSEEETLSTIIPCWSLAALLNAVDFSTINLHYDNARIDWVASATIHDSTKHCTKYESTRALNPVDACVEMIEKLHEQKLL